MMGYFPFLAFIYSHGEDVYEEYVNGNEYLGDQSQLESEIFIQLVSLSEEQ